MNYSSLSKALKYTLATDEDFLRLIHADPSELTNHYAYLDYLNEHDRHDDAEFRQNVIKWHKAGHYKQPDTHLKYPHYVNIDDDDVEGINTPEGVSVDNMPTRRHFPLHESTEDLFPAHNLSRGHYAPEDFPEWQEDHIPHHRGAFGPQTLRWPTYAAMETAFHKAFTARKNRKRRTAK